MKMRLGRPRGAIGWILWFGVVIGLLGMGPVRGHSRLPFGGLFGPAPLGLPSLGWFALFVLSFALLAIRQFSRGEMDSIDDDPPTTLDLSGK